MQVSIWEKESFYSHKDVVIVGAGLAGLWSALELFRLDNKLKILILERGAVPAGASTRNAGFACFGSPTELLHDAETFGENKMWEIAGMRYQGLEKIKAHFPAEVIDYDNCGGFELLDTSYDTTNLDDKLAWLNKGLFEITGMDNVYEINDNRINQFKFNCFTACIENKLEGALHSGKLVQALTKQVLAKGIEILTSTTVKGWEKQGHLIQVITGNLPVITCNKLLVSNNGMASTLIKDISVVPGRGQIVVTSPIDGLPFKGTFHVDQGFYYFRNLGNRVLLGGARNKAFDEETTTELEITGTIQTELEAFLRDKILPGQPFTIDYRWSGIMGFTESKLPVAEEVEPGVFVLVACNGMGVALTPVMAEKAARLVAGK